MGDALRKLALGDLLLTKCALLNNLLLLIEVTHIVRASHYAELTTDTSFFVNLYRTIFFLIRSTGRTDRDALRNFAVLAVQGIEIQLDIGELPAAPLFGVGAYANGLGPKITDGYIVDRFAGNDAS